MTQDEDLPAKTGPAQTITRRNLGRWVKGVSGNPKGRPKGSRNRATIIREALQEATLRQVTEKIPEVLDKAIELALEGNEQMIRMLVKDVIIAPKEVEDTGAGGSGKIQISIKNLTVSPDAKIDAIEGEFTNHSE
jgi:hypothetical protein